MRWLPARRLTVGIALCLAILLVAAATADEEKALPSSITLRITNRMYPDFEEMIQTEMNEGHQVGDTDYWFELTEFYPHFAIIDSTKEIVSLSEEMKNPAFRIKIYEDEELVEETWAFYLLNVPHFARGSYLAFEVMEFDYGGEHHTRRVKDSETNAEESAPKSG
jgi:hypothetical protein